MIITEGRVCAVSRDSMGGNGIEFCARGMEESKSTSTTRSLRLVSIGLGVVGRTSNQNCAGVTSSTLQGTCAYSGVELEGELHRGFPPPPPKPMTAHLEFVGQFRLLAYPPLLQFNSLPPSTLAFPTGSSTHHTKRR